MTAKVAAIVGPTAVGKSAVAVEVAERLEAEIVSVDSMQIYRGMDAGTAKPTGAMRARVLHHLLDISDPCEPVTVKRFQTLARTTIAGIHARARLPLLVGGSGLYWRGVVDELDFPPRSPEVRDALEKEAEERGAAALFARLQAWDPAAAQRVEPANLRRIIRALEVIAVTGRKFSDQDAWGRYESRYRLVVAGLALSRSDLFARIERRAQAMLEQGLIGEVRRLEVSGLGATARQALGYRQVLEADPNASAQEIGAAIVAATKRFARRQESWFRSDPRVTWFDAADAHLVDELVAHFTRHLKRPSP
ncbi:tRNA (adenosine(37)-N6)-dimethylallyltransferase MiaA [soil metagenome]